MSGIRTSLGARPSSVVRIGVVQNVLALLILCSPVTAQSLDDVLARIDRSAPQFKSMSADMKSDMHTAIVNDDTIDNGTIKVKRERADLLARMEFTDGKQVSFDGKTVSIYYPKIKTEQIYNLGNNKALLDELLLLGFGSTGAELKKGYDVSWKGVETVAGKPADRLQLIPRAKELLSHLKRVDLWFPEGSGIPVQQQFLTSASGDYRLVTYSNIKLNPNIDSGSLKLSGLPKDVHIEKPTF